MPLFWTLYIPYYLAPLPYRILKRDYSFFHVRSSLFITLPAIVMTGVILESSQMKEMFNFMAVLPFFLSAPFLLLLLIFIHLPAMRRWGKPVAVSPRFANRYLPNNPRPRPVKFAIDAAEEDGKYADDIFKGLTKYNHQYVEDAARAEVIFALLSRYKKSTAYDPEKQNVYLVIIQTVKDIDRKLQRIQWIDFRRGMKNLDALAQLLPEPAKLFKALGISPMGNQLTLPPIIQVLVYFLTFIGILTFNSWIIFALQVSSSISVLEAALLTPLVGASVGMIFLTVRSLINRAGIMASLRNLILLLLFLLIFLTLFHLHITGYYHLGMAEESSKSIILVWTGLFYLIGLIITTALSLWYIKDLRRWFPSKRRGLLSSFLALVKNPGF